MSRKYILKILIAGAGGVGKTTLIYRAVNKQFSEGTLMTIGVQFSLLELNIDGTRCVLQLWDFGGQERFRFMMEGFMYGAHGALLLFDLTRIKTLMELEEWVAILRKHVPNLPILLVGSKADLPQKVSDALAEEYINDFKLFDWIKVSSKTGYNISLTFKKLASKVICGVT